MQKSIVRVYADSAVHSLDIYFMFEQKTMPMNFGAHIHIKRLIATTTSCMQFKLLKTA